MFCLQFPNCLKAAHGAPAPPQCRQSLPVTAVSAAHSARDCSDPQIVSLLPEDLQNHSYRIRMGVDLAPAVGARSPAAVPTGTYIHTYSQYYSMAGSIAS